MGGSYHVDNTTHRSDYYRMRSRSSDNDPENEPLSRQHQKSKNYDKQYDGACSSDFRSSNRSLNYDNNYAQSNNGDNGHNNYNNNMNNRRQHHKAYGNSGGNVNNSTKMKQPTLWHKNINNCDSSRECSGKGMKHADAAYDGDVAAGNNFPMDIVPPKHFVSFNTFATRNGHKMLSYNF